jgi:small conductance mechanosensitive channel
MVGGREFNRRLKQRFGQGGIEVPCPHRTIYFGVDQDGTAPPLPLPPRAG